MAFEVIPAIDVAGGRVARAGVAGPEPVDAFGGDPIAAARAFADAGARWIHVVDLDLAATGRPANLDVMRGVAGLGVRVQGSGGVSNGAHAEALLRAGASRVVLGSAALADRSATRRLVAELGEALVVGIEADGPTIRPRGGGAHPLPLWETLGWLAELEARRFLLTEVGRVGGLGGPDLDGIWALATHTGKPVIAAGGMRSLADLIAVARLAPNVEGAVVGRAVYDGTLDLAEALAALG